MNQAEIRNQSHRDRKWIWYSDVLFFASFPSLRAMLWNLPNVKAHATQSDGVLTNSPHTFVRFCPRRSGRGTYTILLRRWKLQPRCKNKICQIKGGHRPAGGEGRGHRALKRRVHSALLTPEQPANQGQDFTCCHSTQDWAVWKPWGAARAAG